MCILHFSTDSIFPAQAPTGQTLYFTIVDNCAVVCPQSPQFPYYSEAPAGILVVPESVAFNGHTFPVTALSPDAFAGCDELTDVFLPSSLRSIGQGAFYRCTALVEVDLPRSLRFIGDQAFFGCSSLKRIDIPRRVREIPFSCFSDCVALEQITLRSRLRKIGRYAFFNCPGVIEILL